MYRVNVSDKLDFSLVDVLLGGSAAEISSRLSFFLDQIRIKICDVTFNLIDCLILLHALILIFQIFTRFTWTIQEQNF